MSAAMNHSLEALKAAGVELVEADIENVGALSAAVGFPVVLYETNLLLREYLLTHRPDLSIEDFLDSIASPDVKAVVGDALAGVIDEATYQAAVTEHRAALQAAYQNYFEGHAVSAVIFPTTPIEAQPIATSLEMVTLNGARRANLYDIYPQHRSGFQCRRPWHKPPCTCYRTRPTSGAGTRWSPRQRPGPFSFGSGG